MKKNVLIALVTLVALILPITALGADGQISFTSIAQVEKEMYEDGKKVLVRSKAEMLNPGEIAIYTNSFTNNGTDVAEGLVINNPVPANTEYLNGSATEAGYELTFSVDSSKTFDKAENLTVLDKDGKSIPASAKDYTNIRWTRTEPLNPGQTGSVEFRIMVK
jgi:uncharacterized repeat protein (TIGR01451 family)